MSHKIFAHHSHLMKVATFFEDDDDEVEVVEDPLVDSCAVEKQNDITTYFLESSGNRALFQAFTVPRDITVDRVEVSLQRVGGAAQGNMLVWIYDITGAFPNAICAAGTGRVSKAVLYNDVPVDPSLVAFGFTIPHQLAAGNYGISVETNSNIYLPNAINVGFCMGGDGHYGNGGYFDGTWHADPLSDMIFYLYEKTTTPPANVTPPAGTVVVASWGLENNNQPEIEAIENPDTGYSDSFVCKGSGLLHSARFAMSNKAGNVATDVLVAAKLYAGAIPTDTPIGLLATSDPINASALPAAGASALVDFLFTGVNQVALTDGTIYSIAIEQVGGTLGTDAIWVGHSNSISGNTGQWCILNPSMGGWITQGVAKDPIFYVYAKP